MKWEFSQFTLWDFGFVVQGLGWRGRVSEFRRGGGSQVRGKVLELGVGGLGFRVFWLGFRCGGGVLRPPISRLPRPREVRTISNFLTTLPSKPRSEHGLDCLIRAKFTRQRILVAEVPPRSWFSRICRIFWKGAQTCKPWCSKLYFTASHSLVILEH